MTNDDGESIPSTNGEGWDFFAKAADKGMEEARKRLELDQQEIDRAFARMASTPDGQLVMKALQGWIEGTEDFDPTMGFYNGAAFGFWRTGQRHFLRFIKNAITRGAKA